MAAREIPINVLLQYFRVPTGELVVDYPGRAKLLGSAITNISTTGVFVRTAEPLTEGTELEIAFTMPDSKTQVKAKTIVRWVQRPSPDDPTGPVGMGLEFLRMPPANRKAIARFVEDFLARMRKE